MRITQIRKQLHNYIDTTEVKKLKALYTLLEDDITKGYQLTNEQKKELDRRYDDYMNGVGGTYTLDETEAIVQQALAKRKLSL